MEELIFKYLNRTLTQEENEQLKSWLESQQENRVVLNKLISFYKNDESKLPIMKEVVWNEINRRLGNSDASMKADPPSRWGMILKVAAVFLIVSAIGFVAYQYSIEASKQETLAVNTIFKEAPFGKRITTKLPDGSLVTLNSGSKISFPEQFFGNSRDVILTGEAFFQVQRDELHPFIISTGGVDVRVLGTSFNIRSYPEESKINVAVQEGKVLVSSTSTYERLVLVENEMALYSDSDGKLKKEQILDEQLIFGWKDGKLIFKNQSLKSISESLTKWFGVEFDISGSIEDRTVTAAFTDATLREVMESLSHTYHFEYEINGKKVNIK